MLNISAVTFRNLSEGYGQMAEIKDNLDTGVQQTFLEPLACLENKEIKSILVSCSKQRGGKKLAIVLSQTCLRDTDCS